MDTAVATHWWDDLPQKDYTWLSSSGQREGTLIVDGIEYSYWTRGTFTSRPMIQLIDDHELPRHCAWCINGTDGGRAES